jgi:hypothetical protein
MRWETRDGHRIEETVVRTGGRPARMLHVTRGGDTIGYFASWADLLLAIDVRGLAEDREHAEQG